MNPFFHSLLASQLSAVAFDDSVAPALTVNDVAESSLYWPHVYKSIDWPEVTTTRNYFILFSTDHDATTDLATSGGIWWGEFDGFTETGVYGFIERGKIIEGYQAETPYLVKIPTSVSGLANDTIFLYYHTVDEPGFTIRQETRLITTIGGELHNAVWNDRGRPIGIVGSESHTGYARPFLRADGKYVTQHLFDTNDGQGGKVSESSTGLSFSRIAQFDATENMPSGSYFNRIQIQPFEYNNELYGFINLKGENAGIAITKLHTTTYLPSVFIGSILYHDIRDLRVYIEHGIAYCLFKKGSSEDNIHPYYLWKFELQKIPV